MLAFHLPTTVDKEPFFAIIRGEEPHNKGGFGNEQGI
jgi:hypothetical protein